MMEFSISPFLSHENIIIISLQTLHHERIHYVLFNKRAGVDEREISAVTLPVTIDHPTSENMLENPSQIRTQRFYAKISTVLLVGREIR